MDDGTGWAYVVVAGSVLDEATGEYRLYHATHRAGTNDGGANYATIELSYGDYDPLNPLTMTLPIAHTTDLRIGPDIADVDPRSFE